MFYIEYRDDEELRLEV